MSLSFNNLEKAFKYKSNRDLKQARRLFQLFAFPFLVEQGPKLSNVALSIGIPIKGLIKRTIFHQFCGGEDIESSLASARELSNYGIGAILDYSVEGEGNEKSFNKTFQELRSVIHYAAERSEYPFAVFKCTGIGPSELMRKLTEGEVLNSNEKIQYESFVNRVDELCRAAYEADLPIFIDAEESWIQDAIDLISYEMMAKYNRDRVIVFNTIQLYRTHRLDEIKKQKAIAESKGYKLGFKLVRGAYMEKERERAERMGYPSPIQVDKESTDRDYDLALRYCIQHIDLISICAGTHNEQSSLLLTELMENKAIDRKDDRLWFAQLYGMSDHISFNLADAGYNVAKYLPYGPVKEVLPYLARRAKENSAVKGEAGRELGLIMKELDRRKST